MTGSLIHDVRFTQFTWMIQSTHPVFSNLYRRFITHIRQE